MPGMQLGYAFPHTYTRVVHLPSHFLGLAECFLGPTVKAYTIYLHDKNTHVHGLKEELVFF